MSAALSVACRSKTRQILGVDLRRWTLLGIIAILVILLTSLVARLRGAQLRALPQVQVQGGSFPFSFAWLSMRLLVTVCCSVWCAGSNHLRLRSASSTG